MRFFAPTNVYIEKECVKNHAKELTSFGKKAIIITGRHSAVANGSLADVTGVLEEAVRAAETHRNGITRPVQGKTPPQRGGRPTFHPYAHPLIRARRKGMQQQGTAHRIPAEECHAHRLPRQSPNVRGRNV